MGADRARVAGVVLAAGASTRAGSADKLLLPLEGRPLVWWAATAATEAGLDPVVVVTAPEGEGVRATLTDPRLVHVLNEASKGGLSTSLGLGLTTAVRAAVDPAPSRGTGSHAQITGSGRPEAARRPLDAAVILLADMPWVRARHVERLVAAFDPHGRKAVCVPVWGGRRGNPVLWDSRFFDEIRSLKGDHGARPLMDRHASWVHEVPMPDHAVVRDIDTLADWRAAERG